MVRVNEWLPNPLGLDAAGEWAELYNDGTSAVDLNGWRLTPDGKKFFALKGILAPHGYLVVPKSASKLSLRNADGRLAIYDAAGHLVDQAAFQGAPPEGESVNRTLAGVVFGSPTPGTANASANVGMVAVDKNPLGVLNPPLPAAARFFGPLVGTALALAVAAVFILKAHAGISNILFGGNTDARRGDR